MPEASPKVDDMEAGQSRVSWEENLDKTWQNNGQQYALNVIKDLDAAFGFDFLMPYWCTICNLESGLKQSAKAQVVRLMKERQWSRKEASTSTYISNHNW